NSRGAGFELDSPTCARFTEPERAGAAVCRCLIHGSSSLGPRAGTTSTCCTARVPDEAGGAASWPRVPHCRHGARCELRRCRKAERSKYADNLRWLGKEQIPVGDDGLRRGVLRL